ncbi:tryptophan halogenase family protein [Sphingomonas sp.]|uniref:tryptophan halogenase family protein n=1 Tax=Sphingomonas sp. TaxID=28214 RepID=UPI003B3B5DCC
MDHKRSILIVGGGTAGWLTAAYLAKFLDLARNPALEITVLDSPDIGTIGVGEGAFPTMRTTLQFLGIDESLFIRETAATFKQGIRFVDWLRTPSDSESSHYFHPFEAPFYTEDASLVPYWLLQDERHRRPFAEAVTIQNQVADARRGPKRPEEGAFTGPLNYAYHFDASKLGAMLAKRASELGVQHLNGRVTDIRLRQDGAIDTVTTVEHGGLSADLFIDCSGFRAELIGGALGSPFKSAKRYLFTDRALACKLPYPKADGPLESVTVATAHQAGWTWDIGLAGARGIGTVYSSAHMDDAAAEQVLARYVGARADAVSPRLITFEPGYREQQWIKNCVAVGLSAGFLEPLESTGVVLIEAAVSMIAELFPHNGPIDAPAKRFNTLMTARFDNIITFLKLHYCLSRREEAFWRDNVAPTSIPERLQELLEQWRYRPPNRYDFILDLESFAFFNYQYILYGMDFRTDLSSGRADFPNARAAEKLFQKIQLFGERATAELPTHRALIEQIAASA